MSAIASHKSYTRTCRIIASSPHRIIALIAAISAACNDSTTPGDPVVIEEPLPPHQATPITSNPFAGARLYVDPASLAQKLVIEWTSTRPADAALMAKIANHSKAEWLIDWNSNVRPFVDERTRIITAAGALPVFVAYRIPHRNCRSGSGAASPDAYKVWIREIAAGIGTRKAVVILEPDALAGLDCLSAADQATRLALLKDAVLTLTAQPNVAVYIDAGTSAWQPVSTTVERLNQAGISSADGFALNVANFQTNASTITFGDAVSAATGGKHYVFDTSRNGRGALSGEWCNPAGRGLGTAPSTNTGRATVDAVLWVKSPGESDGTCGGGPASGQFWTDYAMGLAKRAALSNPL
jgi:endoglucanase